MRRRFTRHRPRKAAELLLVPMIDIFTVLVTFLLMTAVFSRIAILELDLPSSAGGGASAPGFRLEVIVRERGIELSNGDATIAAIPNVNGARDLETLTRLAHALKSDHPAVVAASVLLEPEVAYDDLIQVMDAIRSMEAPVEGEAEGAGERGSTARARAARLAASAPAERIELFTEIAVGDAP